MHSFGPEPRGQGRESKVEGRKRESFPLKNKSSRFQYLRESREGKKKKKDPHVTKKRVNFSESL